MIGAIIGDIVGSVYEFDNIKTKKFPLISAMSQPTDDTIMTLAVAEILQNGYADDSRKVAAILKKWGARLRRRGLRLGLLPMAGFRLLRAIQQLRQRFRHARFSSRVVR